MLRTDISNSAYHGSGELSRSVAWQLVKSCPAKVWHQMQNPTPDDAPHFVVGGCTHTATLEPHKLDDEYAFKPESIDGNSSRTNYYKAAFQEMQDHAPDKRWLTKSDYDTCMRMADSAREHPLLQTYLDDPGTIIEGTGYFGYEGAECKVRPDLFNPAGVVIDLKTTQEGDPKGFGYSVKKYGYDFQSAFYMEGLRRMGYNPTQFIYLCVEKSAPYLTSAYEIDAGQVDRMKVKMGEACRTWVKCMETGEWPGYGDHVQTLHLGGRQRMDSNRLSISEIATYFNCSRTYVYKIIKKFDLKSQIFGRRRTIDMTEFATAFNTPTEEEAA